jgi:hypothetical protein
MIWPLVCAFGKDLNSALDRRAAPHCWEWLGEEIAATALTATAR